MTTHKAGFDYIGIGVGALIVNEQGKLFLAQRGLEAKNERGLWEFPGGTVEFGEELQAALRREIQEEYDFLITVGELFTVNNHLLPAEQQHWVSPSFFCRPESGEPVIVEPTKCSQIGWFSVSEIETLSLTQITQNETKLLRERKATGLLPVQLAW